MRETIESVIARRNGGRWGPVFHNPPDFALYEGRVVSADFVQKVVGERPDIIRDGGGFDTLPHRNAHRGYSGAREKMADFVESCLQLTPSVEKKLERFAKKIEACDIRVGSTSERLDKSIRVDHGKVVPAREYVEFAKMQIAKKKG